MKFECKNSDRYDLIEKFNGYAYLDVDMLSKFNEKQLDNLTKIDLTKVVKAQQVEFCILDNNLLEMDCYADEIYEISNAITENNDNNLAWMYATLLIGNSINSNHHTMNKKIIEKCLRRTDLEREDIIKIGGHLTYVADDLDSLNAPTHLLDMMLICDSANIELAQQFYDESVSPISLANPFIHYANINKIISSIEINDNKKR